MNCDILLKTECIRMMVRWWFRHEYTERGCKIGDSGVGISVLGKKSAFSKERDREREIQRYRKREVGKVIDISCYLTVRGATGSVRSFRLLFPVCFMFIKNIHVQWIVRVEMTTRYPCGSLTAMKRTRQLQGYRCWKERSVLWYITLAGCQSLALWVLYLRGEFGKWIYNLEDNITNIDVTAGYR